MPSESTYRQCIARRRGGGRGNSYNNTHSVHRRYVANCSFAEVHSQ